MKESSATAPESDVEFADQELGRTDPGSPQMQVGAIERSAETFQTSFNEWVSGVTALTAAPQSLEDQVWALFDSARYEVFEDGIETPFSRQLPLLVIGGGAPAIEPLVGAILSAKPSVAAEALRWLGRMHHNESQGTRLWLLQHELGAESPEVRDGAALGLAAMDDPRAVPDLERAIQREGIDELREDLTQVLRQLQDASTPPKD